MRPSGRRSRGRSRGLLDDALGAPATPRTSSVARCATWSLGRTAADWDLATDALPRAMLELLPDAVYENRFGTVAVRRDGEVYEITTFRSDHEYADFRRPHHVEFGDTVELDLARRDLTCNAMAWGARAETIAAAERPGSWTRTTGSPTSRPAPCARSAIRGGGSRRTRSGWSGPSVSRRRSASGWSRRRSPGSRLGRSSSRHLSGERIATELDKLLAADEPSVGLRLLGDTGLLAGISPELAAQRGIPQNKVAGRGPVGPHDADRRCGTGRSSGGPPGGARPRHRQAGDLRRRPLHRARFRRCRPGRCVPGPAPFATLRARADRPPRAEPHVQLRAELVGRRRAPLHREDLAGRRVARSAR